MKKPFIKHDLFTCNDDKIKKLLSKFHEAGYGIWWSIVEQLSQDEEHKLSISDLIENVQCDLRAKNTSTISAVVDFCIQYNLLVQEDELVYSERVLAQYEEINEIRKKNSENVKMRWENDKKAKELNENNTVVYENDTVVSEALYEGNTDNKDSKDNKDNKDSKDNKDNKNDKEDKERKDTKVSKRKDYISFVQECYKNSCSEKFPKLIKMSEAREAHCYNLVEKFGKDKVKEGFEKASKSAFLTGVNDNGWKATFDWLVLPSNFLKVLEGNYDNKEPIKKLPKSSVCTAGAFEGQKNAQGGFDL